jgi:hypothetical protein
MKRRSKVYITGPRSSRPNQNRFAFSEAARDIEEWTDLIPLHTAWFRHDLTQEEFLELSLEQLSLCDLVCTLPGWRKGKRSSIEVAIAKDAGLPIIAFKNIKNLYGRKEEDNEV